MVTYTKEDLRKAFNDGKSLGDGELELLDNYDFSNKPNITYFDVWFDKFGKKKLKK